LKPKDIKIKPREGIPPYRFLGTEPRRMPPLVDITVKDISKQLDLGKFGVDIRKPMKPFPFEIFKVPKPPPTPPPPKITGAVITELKPPKPKPSELLKGVYQPRITYKEIPEARPLPTLKRIFEPTDLGRFGGGFGIGAIYGRRPTRPMFYEEDIFIRGAKPITKGLEIPKQLQWMRITPITRQISITKQITKQFPITKQVQVQVQIPVQKQVAKQIQLQKLLQRQKQIQKQVQATTSWKMFRFARERRPRPWEITKPIPFLIKLPKLGIKFPKYKPKKMKLEWLRPTRYTPSLVALGEKIYGKKPRRLVGIYVRPILR